MGIGKKLREHTGKEKQGNLMIFQTAMRKMQKPAKEHQGKSSENYETWIGFLGGGLIFLKNSPLLGEMIQFDYIYICILVVDHHPP